MPAPVLAYFTTGASRSIKVKKNIVLSLVIRCSNIAISFLLVPLTINYVNPTQYGIWITLSSIIAWFSFFDIGFGNGLRNKFAEAVALGKHKLARVYVSTTYGIIGIMMTVVVLVFAIINPQLEWSKILNTESALSGELAVTALLVLVFFCIQFILQILNVVLTANQEPARAAAFKFYSNVLSLLIIFILTSTTEGDLIKLSVALGVAPILVLFVSSAVLYNGRYRLYAPNPRLVDFRFAKALMGLGIKFFIIQVSGIVLYSTHSIIITQVFGPSEVTTYSLAYKYFSAIMIVFGIIITPFWSAVTEAYTKNDFSWIRRSMKGMLTVAVLLIGVLLAMFIFYQEAFELWIGNKVRIPFMLSLMMTIYFAMSLLLQPFTYFVNGTGKVHLQLLYTVITALINIPLAIYLAKTPGVGISGVMLATIICFLPGFIMTPIQYSKIMNGTAKNIWSR